MTENHAVQAVPLFPRPPFPPGDDGCRFIGVSLNDSGISGRSRARQRSSRLNTDGSLRLAISSVLEPIF